MSFELNAHIRQLIAAGAGPAGSPGFTDFATGDAAALREILDHGLAQMNGLPADPTVTATTHRTTTADGHELELRFYEKAGSFPGSAVVYLHGGAMLAGSVDLYDPLVRASVAWTGVPFLAVDYRLAPGVPAGTPAWDALLGLQWLLDHSPELGVDPARIAIMGDSAGGGVAAAVAVLARDVGIGLARQILMYPMLDDRNTVADPQLSTSPTMFSYAFNLTAWSAVLGDAIGTDAVSPAAAPARNVDFSGLAPAYIEVGEMDIFRDEDVAYAQKLWRAGVPTELHVHPGYPHAFDILLIGDELGERHKDEKIRIIRSL